MVALPLAAGDGGPSLLFVGLLVVLAVLALAFLGGAVLSLARWWHLRQSSAEEFRASLAGPIELVGPAQTADDSEPFNAAVSGTDCLISKLEVQVYETDGKTSSWQTRESRTTTRPFIVDTSAGRVRVEPEGADLVLATETVDELDGGEDATGRTAAALDALDVKRTSGSVDIGITELDYGDRMRIRESRVDVGEAVYVAGTAVTNDPTVGGFGGPDAVVREQTDRSLGERLFGFPFVVGDGGESAVRWHFLKRGLLFVAFAVVFAAVWAVALAGVL